METSCTNFSFFMFFIGMFTLWCYMPWSSKENEERCERVMTRIDKALDYTPVRCVIFVSIWGFMATGYINAMYFR